MRGFKFFWDIPKGLFGLKWNGLFSIDWERGKILWRVLGLPISSQPSLDSMRFPMRWFYIKNSLSFITQWRIERMEGKISFSDPMINGVLFGWLNAIEGIKTKKRLEVTVNFLGKNRFSGQASIPPRVLFSHLRRWILPILLEMWRRRREERKREVNDQWMQQN